MNAKPKIPAPPAHLRAPTAAWWTSVCEEYELQPHHLRLLEAAASAWDRACEARELIARDGCVVQDRFKQDKAHPACAIERDAIGTFTRSLRELGLDTEPPVEAARPPQLRHYR